MKLTLLQENIHKALQDALRFVSHKPQLPILTGIALHAEHNILTIQSTDLKVGFQTKIGAKVEIPGSCIVQGKIFVELLSSLSPGPIEMKQENEHIHISQRSIKGKLPLFAVADFPPFPICSATPFLLDKQIWSNLINSVLFAASMDETRPVLSSLYLSLQEGMVSGVCTDGYRLSITRLPVLDTTTTLEVLLPAKAMHEVQSIIEHSGSKQIGFGVSEELSQAFFFIDQTSILLRTIEGKFPPYEQVIPKEFTFETILNRQEWISGLKTALVFAKEASSIIMLEFEGKTCCIRSASINTGEQEGKIASSTIAEEKKTISFNGRFLLDVLNRFSEDEVLFKMNDKTKPGVIIPVKSDYPLSVVMPFKR